VLSVRIRFLHWVFDLDCGPESDEEPDDEEPETVLPFGFAVTDIAEPAADPVFREL
jgi:hypothetical protein